MNEEASTEDGLRLTVLGCSGTYPGPDGACSGYLVQASGRSLWVDTGPGTLARLQRHVDLLSLDAVLVSHVHPDHWLDLPVLRNALRYVLGRSGLPVYTTAAVFESARNYMPDVEETLDIHVVSGGDRFEVAGIDVEVSRTDHSVETLAMRFSHAGRSLGYSSDTGPGWSMAEFSAPVDLAVWEATTPDPVGGGVHTAAPDTGRLAAEAGVGRLVLTHLLPGSDAALHQRLAADAFGGSVEVAEDGRTYHA